MSLYVVDASVGVKWFVPEIDSNLALRLQDPAHELHFSPFLSLDSDPAGDEQLRSYSRRRFPSRASL